MGNYGDVSRSYQVESKTKTTPVLWHERVCDAQVTRALQLKLTHDPQEDW